MGRVWRARDELLEREVAIKEMIPPATLDAEGHRVLVSRFAREARSAARLNHHSIVTVHDVLIEPDCALIVMEFVAGSSLDDVISSSGALSPLDAALIGVAVLDALSEAHAAGIIHRDVKPSNILIARNRVVLTDFGIALSAGDAALTQSGVVGTADFMAPERARGTPATPASDLWSLAATLYMCVEGHPPFSGPDAMAVLSALLTDDPPPASRAGPLAPLLDGLLRKDPSQRLGAEQARRLLAEIVSLAQSHPIAAVDPPTLVAAVLNPADLGLRGYAATAQFGAAGGNATPTQTARRPAVKTEAFAAWAFISSIIGERPDCAGVVTPIDTVTNTAADPIRLSDPAGKLVITPDGKTVYAAAATSGSLVVIPIDVGAHIVGKSIKLGGRFASMAITPDGKTLYVASIGPFRPVTGRRGIWRSRPPASMVRNALTPIDTATNTAGAPIEFWDVPSQIAFAPDGETAYVISKEGMGRRGGRVIAMSTSTNTLGAAARLQGSPDQIVIAPDGNTAYLIGSGLNMVTPFDMVAHTPSPAIEKSQFGEDSSTGMAMTPDGRTLYIARRSGIVTPVSTVTNTVGKPIKLQHHLSLMSVTPDGAVVYVVSREIIRDRRRSVTSTLTPISTAVNAPGQPIDLPLYVMDLAITPDSRTAYVTGHPARTASGVVIPISIATNTPGEPIKIEGRLASMAIAGGIGSTSCRW
jgi:DNA-binding beta-propeller fold protein YncE